MRTYDKLIATIFSGQTLGHLHPCTGTSLAAHADNTIVNIAAQQEAG
jgi:hypothetical protein